MAQDPMPAWSAMMAAWHPRLRGNEVPIPWSWMVPTMQDGARGADGNGGATIPADPVQAWAEMVRWWQEALKTSAAGPWPAQLAPNSAPSAVTTADAMTPATAARAFKPMLDAIAASGPVAAYWLDAWQRTVLTLDALRKRGNQSLEHKKSGKPPVLSFPYELVVDGRTLERPVNYQLLKITVPPGVTFDPKARPYMIFDPRAGHGPGIGGFKEASQVGVALRSGHPVYFVSFLPQPVPGQTIEDVARAEVRFMEKVIALHPEAESAPAMVGNCQGGWGLMLAASLAPTLPGVISVAGAPLSYWGGRRGENPMRYTGGLAGGSWMASLTGDLGNGLFDGAYLVDNFENLNPSNTYVGKMHHLYRHIDTEEPRFLGFERWWGGHFYMTVEEMRFIVDNLFVGNKLTRDKLYLSDGSRVDLRAIRAPIVVIASKGDNITPPQQALNWILDLYGSVAEMRARQQTIIYTVHDSIGHLGIFVSAKVAMKEHAEFVNALDMIEVLPPGLYEMVIESEEVVEAGRAGEHSQYVCRLEARDLDAIRAFDDDRDDEASFHTVARMSEINEALYDTYLRPWVKAFSNELTAETLRASQPVRVEREIFSDKNPLMAWVAQTAETVRADRRPVGDDNPFVVAEKDLARKMEEAFDQYRDSRDAFVEKLFFSIYESPAIRALTGMEAHHGDHFARPRDELMREWVQLKLESLYNQSEAGDFAEAVYRIGFACLEVGKVQDARAYRMTRKIAKDHPRLKDLTRREVKEKARRAAFIVQFDPEGALETLPDLLPGREEQEDALRVIRGIVSWRPDIAPEHAAVIEKVERVFAHANENVPGEAAAGDSAAS
jgi:pimeloyl-ACP methyl ester carboxylesterase